MLQIRKTEDGRAVVPISTPHVFPDGDHILIMAERIEGNDRLWRLTDMGWTIAHYWNTGHASALPLSTLPKRKQHQGLNL